MAAPTTTSALAPDVEHSHASVNEPSMEDILASIRRIIAEDQSNNLGRSGLGGLTRRQSPPPSVIEEAAPVAPAELSVAQLPAEPEPHLEPQAEIHPHADEPTADAPQAPAHEFFAAEPGDASRFETTFVSEPDYHVYDSQPDEPQGQAGSPNGDDTLEPLMSPVAGASITSSFQTLAESVMLQDPGLIERVMRESMRPLLKSWLDDHLPSIVERLVRTEIERVARGGRGRNA